MVTLLEMRAELGRLRGYRRLTLDQLAERTGLDRATIHQMENVKTYPRLDAKLETFYRIVVALEMPFAEFFRRVEGAAALPPAPPADLQQRSVGLPLPPAPPIAPARGATRASGAAKRSTRATGRRR
jgi:transcriptional regulator with XRE-family HTH domain